MMPAADLAAADRRRPRERDNSSDRLRNRFSGPSSTPAADTTAQGSPRRRESIDDNASQISMSSNAPTIGSGSHLGSPRIAKTGWSRRPKVTFPTGHNSGTEHTSSYVRPKSSRPQLRSAVKTTFQRPLTPPLPVDRTSGPSLSSLLDSNVSSERTNRPRRLSFLDRLAATPDKRPGVPGGWADSFLPPVTNAFALTRRNTVSGPRNHQPSTISDSFGSDSEYTDSELSDDTHATTVMSDATVDSPKVQRKTRITVQPSQKTSRPAGAAATAPASVITASTNKSGRRTLTIEVLPPKESEEDKRRREQIENDLRAKIASLERRLKAEAADTAKVASLEQRLQVETENNAKRQQQLQRQLASVTAAKQQVPAPAPPAANPQTLAPVRPPPPVPSQGGRLSPSHGTASLPASPQLNAQARPFQPSPRPRSTTTFTPLTVVPAIQQQPPASPSSNQPFLMQQVESESKQLADLRAALSERDALVIAAGLERDEARNLKDRFQEECRMLEAEVRSVRTARSHAEEVTIARLAACELVRDVLRIKVEGFESEVKTKAMVIENLSVERDRLGVALEATAGEVAVLTERSRMLEADRATACAEIIGLKEELVRVRAHVEALERDKLELEVKVSGLQSDLVSAQAKVVDLEGSVKEKNDSISKLEAGNGELKSEVEQLTAANAAKGKDLDESTAKLTEAQAALATSQASLAVVETNLATATQENAASAQEKTKEISELQEKLTAAEANMTTATAEKDTLLTSLQEKLAAAEAEATKTLAELKEAQAKTPEDYAVAVISMAKEKEELASKITTLQAEVESRAAEANDMVTTFASEKAKLEAEKVEVEESRAAAADEAARLSLHAAQLKTKFEALKSKKTVPTTAAASAAAAVKSTKTVKTKADFFFVRTSQDRGRMHVVKKSELKSSRSSSQTPSAKDE